MGHTPGMGLFDFLKKNKEPEGSPSMEHPVFGKAAQADEGTWEGGRVQFAPAGKLVDVVIMAGAEGPGEGHVDFVKELENRWPSLLEQTEELVRGKLKGWVKKAGEGSPWSWLELDSLEVYGSMSEELEWKIRFWCEECGHSLVLGMKGWRGVNASVEG